MALLSSIAATTSRITVMSNLLNLPPRPPPVIARTAATLDILSGAASHFTGARPGPRPLHDIGIWLGAYQPRMLKVTGSIADGWLPSSSFLPPDNLAQANGLIDAAAEGAGRSPKDVRRGHNIEATFSSGSGFLDGPPKLWVEQLTHLALTHDISGFLLYRASSADDLRRFGAEVAPAVREAVARERGQANEPSGTSP